MHDSVVRIWISALLVTLNSLWGFHCLRWVHPILVVLQQSIKHDWVDGRWAWSMKHDGAQSTGRQTDPPGCPLWWSSCHARRRRRAEGLAPPSAQPLAPRAAWLRWRPLADTMRAVVSLQRTTKIRISSLWLWLELKLDLPWYWHTPILPRSGFLSS